LSPIGLPVRILNWAIERRALRHDRLLAGDHRQVARRGVDAFAFDSASPRPMLTTIFSSFGTWFGLAYSNCLTSAGTTSVVYSTRRPARSRARIAADGGLGGPRGGGLRSLGAAFGPWRRLRPRGSASAAVAACGRRVRLVAALALGGRGLGSSAARARLGLGGSRSGSPLGSRGRFGSLGLARRSRRCRRFGGGHRLVVSIAVFSVPSLRSRSSGHLGLGHASTSIAMPQCVHNAHAPAILEDGWRHTSGSCSFGHTSITFETLAAARCR
jgi:hypothetical protein